MHESCRSRTPFQPPLKPSFVMSNPACEITAAEVDRLVADERLAAYKAIVAEMNGEPVQTSDVEAAFRAGF